MSKVVSRGRGRPAIFGTAQGKVAALNAIKNGEGVSTYLAKKLVAESLVEVVAAPSNGQRGRPAHTYTLTGAGRSRLALLSRNIAKAQAKAAQA